MEDCPAVMLELTQKLNLHLKKLKMAHATYVEALQEAHMEIGEASNWLESYLQKASTSLQEMNEKIRNEQVSWLVGKTSRSRQAGWLSRTINLCEKTEDCPAVMLKLKQKLHLHLQKLKDAHGAYVDALEEAHMQVEKANR